MMRTILTALAFGGVFATVAHAQATEEHVAALVAAIEANGCVISEANADAILGATGLTPEEGGAALDALGEAGEAADATVKLNRNEDGTVTMVSPNCPAE